MSNDVRGDEIDRIMEQNDTIQSEMYRLKYTVKLRLELRNVQHDTCPEETLSPTELCRACHLVLETCYKWKMKCGKLTQLIYTDHYS